MLGGFDPGALAVNALVAGFLLISVQGFGRLRVEKRRATAT